MKTRNGFVSNSSSSSFIAYGLHVPHMTGELIMTMIALCGMSEEEFVKRFHASICSSRWLKDETYTNLYALYQNKSIDIEGFLTDLCESDYSEFRTCDDWMQEVFKGTIFDGLGYKQLEEEIGNSDDNVLFGYTKNLGDDGFYGIMEFNSLTEQLNMGAGLAGLSELGKELNQTAQLYIGTIYS